MKTSNISRSQVSKVDKIYKKILKTEKHHKHKIVKDQYGTIRWEENQVTRKILDEKINLNDLMILFESLGYNKNSEIIRELYRNIGYSLFGYWEIFYWEVNNEIANEYIPNQK